MARSSAQGRTGGDEPGRAAVRRPVSRRPRRPAAGVLARLPVPGSEPGRLAGPLGLAAVVVAAALLRLWSLAGAQVNPFYDAAVRSMGLSWHNFFFGAFEPGGRIAVDKPPIDLWLQVASTKLIGFNTTALLLPEALGGITAAALLYATIRPIFGRRAGVLAGLALAVLPISVLTSRSDTMDSVMMALLVAALWASVRGLRTRHVRWVTLAAGLVGLAFNVKLSEALVPLPALGLMWLGVARGRQRLLAPAGAGLALVAVGMLWISVASLTPAAKRPYPIGSRTGSIYQAVFVYNGIERLNGTSAQVAPIGGASPVGPTRLLVSEHPFYGPRIGLELLAALALGLACALAGLRGSRPSRLSLPRLARPRLRPTAGRDFSPPAFWTPAPFRAGDPAPGAAAAPTPPRKAILRAGGRTWPRLGRSVPRPSAAAAVLDGRLHPVRRSAPSRPRVRPLQPAAPPARAGVEAHARRWLVLGLVAWLATAGLLFSSVRDLQPRYLEALTPAVAAAVGLGCATLLGRALERATALRLGLAVAASVAFAMTVGSVPGAALDICLASGGLTLVLLAAGAVRPPSRLRAVWTGVLSLACATALLAAPIGVSIDLIETNATAAGVMGSGAEFSTYLHSHRHGAYYETASSSVYAVTTLIVKDAQPVLILSDFHGPLVTLGKLRDLVSRGAVRHIIISHACRGGPHCPLTTRWSLKHAREVVRGGLYEYILPLSPAARPCAARGRPSPSCRPPVKPRQPAPTRHPPIVRARARSHPPAARHTHTG